MYSACYTENTCLENLLLNKWMWQKGVNTMIRNEPLVMQLIKGVEHGFIKADRVVQNHDRVSLNS